MSLKKREMKKLFKKIDGFGLYLSDEHLIRFDKKVLVVIFLSLLIFVLAVAFKINGSSDAFWNRMFSGYNQKEGVLLGEPKGIRSDEWFISTVTAISQVEEGLPVHNYSEGYYNDPLITSMPVKHITTLVKPQFWGYFFLKTERAFSLYWNFRVVTLFLSTFLLLLLLTKNNFWLSLLGGVWVYFSSFLQWWFSALMPEASIFFSLTAISAAYLLFAKKKYLILFGGIGLLVFGLNFVFIFYPPLQVPLGFLMIFILLGFFLRDRKNLSAIFRKEAKTRFLILFGVIFLAGTLLYKFYIDSKSTIQAITNTVYPGKRTSFGGGLNLHRLFSGFFSNFFTKEGTVPPIWSNICEASTFIMFYPLTIVFFIYRVVQKKKLDWIVILLSVYAILLTLFVLFPVPELLAKMTLFNLVTPNRALLTLGITSIILSILTLNEIEKERIKIPHLFKILLSVVVLLFLIWVGYKMKLDSVQIRYRTIGLISIFFAFVVLLFTTKLRKVSYLLLAAAVIIPNAFVNPVTYGLQPIFNKEIARAIKELDLDEKQKVAVFGNFVFANYYKSQGLTVFNGTKYTPDLEAMRLLDPDGKNAFIYNRYATITLLPTPRHGDKDITFHFVQNDLYSITIDPCNPILKKINIGYISLDQEYSDYSQNCLTPLFATPKDGLMLYKYK
jgi:hypothetical protein